MITKRGTGEKTDRDIHEYSGGYMDDSFLSVIFALLVGYVVHDCLALPLLLAVMASGAVAEDDAVVCCDVIREPDTTELMGNSSYDGDLS